MAHPFNYTDCSMIAGYLANGTPGKPVVEKIWATTAKWRFLYLGTVGIHTGNSSLPLTKSSILCDNIRL